MAETREEKMQTKIIPRLLHLLRRAQVATLSPVRTSYDELKSRITDVKGKQRSIILQIRMGRGAESRCFSFEEAEWVGLGTGKSKYKRY